MDENFELVAIGIVRKEEEKTWIEIFNEYEKAILKLDEFSHIITLWWITGRDTEEDRKNLQAHPKVSGKVKDAPLCGVFATRSPARPNPIGLTTMKILSINKNRIYIDRTDAFDNTPIIDIKPYIPKSDCIMNVTLPDFFDILRERREE